MPNTNRFHTYLRCLADTDWGGYHIRVAVAECPEGPYRDTGTTSPIPMSTPSPSTPMSLPLNGTEGEWRNIEGIPVRLDAGCYEIALDFVKPGLELGHLSFVPETGTDCRPQARLRSCQ